MKRYFVLIISLILVLSLAACGRAERTPAMEPKNRSSSVSESAPAPSSLEPSFSEPPSVESEPEKSSTPESPSPSGESEEKNPPQSDADTVIETIPQEEQLNYFRKYIEPYYIVGLMYQTWSNPEEIELLRYMRFYIYNESDNYWRENPADDNHSIPADIVEDYITSYFEVSPDYLRTSDYYDPAINGYRGMFTEGIGGGPGVVIERIEKDEDTWKFVCRDESGNQPSVTIRVFGENSFCYIAGEGLNL